MHCNVIQHMTIVWTWQYSLVISFDIQGTIICKSFHMDRSVQERHYSVLISFPFFGPYKSFTRPFLVIFLHLDSPTYVCDHQKHIYCIIQFLVSSLVGNHCKLQVNFITIYFAIVIIPPWFEWTLLRYHVTRLPRSIGSKAWPFYTSAGKLGWSGSSGLIWVSLRLRCLLTSTAYSHNTRFDIIL